MYASQFIAVCELLQSKLIVLLFVHWIWLGSYFSNHRAKKKKRVVSAIEHSNGVNKNKPLGLDFSNKLHNVRPNRLSFHSHLPCETRKMAFHSDLKNGLSSKPFN